MNAREASEQAHRMALSVESRRSALASVEQSLQRMQGQLVQFEARRGEIATQLASGRDPVAELESGAAQLVSHENDAWVRNQVPDLLSHTEVLLSLGATSSIDAARVWLQQPTGALVSLDLPARTSPAPLVSLTAAGGLPLPLHEQRTNENYWMTPIEGTRALYVQYNRCQNGGEPFRTFAERVFRLLDSGGADRLIVDVRHNGGGDSEVDNPLIEGLQGRSTWRARPARRAGCSGDRPRASARRSAAPPGRRAGLRRAPALAAPRRRCKNGCGP